MTQATHEHILIVDFGSQVTQLIARRVREAGVYCEVHPYNRAQAVLDAGFDPKAIILSGGPASVCDAGSPRAPQGVFDLGIPILAICYGQQTLATCDVSVKDVAPQAPGSCTLTPIMALNDKGEDIICQVATVFNCENP